MCDAKNSGGVEQVRCQAADDAGLLIRHHLLCGLATMLVQIDQAAASCFVLVVVFVLVMCGLEILVQLI